jgi:hypothetical protein
LINNDTAGRESLYRFSGGTSWKTTLTYVVGTWLISAWIRVISAARSLFVPRSIASMVVVQVYTGI